MRSSATSTNDDLIIILTRKDKDKLKFKLEFLGGKISAGVVENDEVGILVVYCESLNLI